MDGFLEISSNYLTHMGLHSWHMGCLLPRANGIGLPRVPCRSCGRTDLCLLGPAVRPISGPLDTLQDQSLSSPTFIFYSTVFFTFLEDFTSTPFREDLVDQISYILSLIQFISFFNPSSLPRYQIEGYCMYDKLKHFFEINIFEILAIWHKFGLGKILFKFMISNEHIFLFIHEFNVLCTVSHIQIFLKYKLFPII